MSNLSEEIVSRRKRHLPETFDGDHSAILGKKYWLNFKKRYPEIKQKKCIEKFKTMCDHFYAAMVKSRVAIELESEVMVTLDGIITENEEESSGKTKYLPTHPELVVVVDEVGSNTSQKHVGNVGG